MKKTRLSILILSFILIAQSQQGYAMRNTNPSHDSSAGKPSDEEEIRRIAQELQFEIEGKPSQGDSGQHHAQIQTSFHLPQSHFVNPSSGTQQLQTLSAHPSTQPYPQWGASSFGVHSFGASSFSAHSFGAGSYSFNPFSTLQYFNEANSLASRSFQAPAANTNPSLLSLVSTSTQGNEDEPVSKRANLEQETDPLTLPASLNDTQIIQKFEEILSKYNIGSSFFNAKKIVKDVSKTCNSTEGSHESSNLSTLLMSISRLGYQNQDAQKELEPYTNLLRYRVFSFAIDAEDIPDRLKDLFKGEYLKQKLSTIKTSIDIYKNIVDDLNQFCESQDLTLSENKKQYDSLHQRITRYGLDNIRKKLDEIRSPLYQKLVSCYKSRELSISQSHTHLFSTQNLQQSMQLALNPVAPSCVPSTASMHEASSSADASSNSNPSVPHFEFTFQENSSLDPSQIMEQTALKIKLHGIRDRISQFFASTPATLVEAEKTTKSLISAAHHNTLDTLSQKVGANDELKRFRKEARLLIESKLGALRKSFYLNVTNN